MAKGSSFEREVCKQLSLWWSGGRDDSMFWRSSQSGGRATVRARKGKRTSGHCGDICATDPKAAPFTKLFTVEVKRGYPKHNPMFLLATTSRKVKPGFEEFIRQAEKAARRARTPYWLVIHKWDQRVPLVYFPREFFLNVMAGKMDPGTEYVLFCHRFGGCRLEDFLRTITPVHCHHALEEWKRGDPPVGK